MKTKRLFSVLMFSMVLVTSNAQSLINKTLLWEGNNREYAIYLPASYDGSTDFPLLFNFHGGGGFIATWMELADMRPIADTANFILVYPQAFPDPTDGGSTNWIRKSPTTFDDVPFVQALIDTISTEYNINSDKVYACGYSLGGELTYELACRLNDQFAAVGVVARTMGTETFYNCSPEHPTGILTILGTDDFISPYDGYPGYYQSADEVHNYWVNYNNCNSTPTITSVPDTDPTDGSTVERYIWDNSDGCAFVQHLKVIGGGHDWPGSFGNMDIDASQEIWSFVSNYNKTGLGCATLAISDINSSQINYRVYPNPFDDQLIIESEFIKTKEFKIYSILGTPIITGILTPGTNTINLSSLPANIYFLRSQNQLIKLIKSE